MYSSAMHTLESCATIQLFPRYICYRHSNVNCDDDAASCQREAAIKFADQNEDGPLDLILFTGRTAPARNSKGLGEILKLTTPNEVRAHCEKDPQ